ncbi:MAG: fumarylacetoacetate hydrolase family protein [Tannerellaceae bacterium]|jgi:2-keto-4-pentenoate hydratase/2-oxohepta-3-ene-1,7-dioic acid hydratase in catechol pathway|nr:fumarylacetoacetate hydrolase family protein [Tannerellaceae bacterium]
MKIIAVDANYAPCNKEVRRPLVDEEPVIFMKTESSALKNGKPFFMPDYSVDIHYGTEIVVKINRLGKNIAERFARRYYDEVTVGIDLTARDILQRLRSQGLPWEISKAFDNSAVVGSFIPLSEADDGGIRFHLDINGRRAQEGDTAGMIFTVDRIIACASRYFTLKMGDLIYTGTPAGTGPVRAGDHLEGYIGNRKLLDFNIR